MLMMLINFFVYVSLFSRDLSRYLLCPLMADWGHSPLAASAMAFKDGFLAVRFSRAEHKIEVTLSPMVKKGSLDGK